MKIGIIGSGGVAQTLGSAYLGKGHDIKLGSRNTEKLADWLKSAGEKASAGSFAEAAAFGDVVFLSVKGEAALEAVELAGSENLRGKTLIDLTNPLDFPKEFRRNSLLRSAIRSASRFKMPCRTRTSSRLLTRSARPS